MPALIPTRPVVLAKEVKAEPAGLFIRTDAGRFVIPWDECSENLARASEIQRLYIDVMPSGYGIHWPLIDEDLAVGPLIEGRKPL